MSVAQLEGGASSRRATWCAQLEESKRDMGLLDNFASAAGRGSPRSWHILTVLRRWNERKTEARQDAAFSFDIFREGTGT